MKKSILLLLILVVGGMCACSGKNSIDGLLAETISFQGSTESSNGLASSSFGHTFSRSLSRVPQIAFGIWDTNFGASSAQQFSQFSIEASQIKTTSVKFIFRHKSKVWTSIKIGFWASVLPEITIGNSFTNFGSLRSSGKVQAVQTGPIASAQRAIVRVFLNGFALNSGSTGIQVQLASKVSGMSEILVQILSGPKTDLRSVSFSYIAFSPSDIPYSSFGGVVIENSFTGTEHKDIKNLVHLPKYALQGLTKIDAPLSAGISANIDDDFIFSYTVNGAALDFSYTYIFVGTKDICSDCIENYAYLNQCVNVCPSQTYPKPYSTGAFGCFSCSPKLNLIINAQKSGCQCAAGYKMNGDVCEKVSADVFGPVNTDSFGSFGFGNNLSQNQPTEIPLIAATTPTPSNSYPVNIPQQPTIPQQPVIPQTLPTSNTGQTTPTTQSKTAAQVACENTPNSYWTGNNCACRVGYRKNYSTGECEKISLVIPVSTLPINNVQTNCGENAFFNGASCVCQTGYSKNSLNQCVVDFFCPENSAKIGNSCVCNSGYKKVVDKCIKETVAPCGANSYRNTLGFCVCNTGYIKSGEECVKDNRCPQNEIVNGAGQCVCIAGYYRNSQRSCVRCEGGAVWTGTQCSFICGIHEKYNTSTKKCDCETGYGKLNNICSICSGNYFLFQGFCVACPIFAEPDQQGGCRCKSDHTLTGGVCVPKCKANEEYINNKCQCFEGLGRLADGTCGICPSGQTPNPTTQQCGGCGANQQLSGGVCVCSPGFGISTNNACLRCESNGKFLLDGYCVECPTGSVYNGVQCVCPEGTVRRNGVCSQQCSTGQLADAAGFCYTCPLNEMIMEGKCVCRTGFVRNPATSSCEISCPSGQNIINGVCATCALNTVFDSNLKACICAPGFFANTAGFCEEVILTPVTCTSGKYYDAQLGCLSCPSGCSTCLSASRCTACTLPGFIPMGAQCVRGCGNGVVNTGETCDDSNTASGDGCSNTCQTENGYQCSGSPSNCKLKSVCGNGIVESGEMCDDGAGRRGDGDGCSSNCREESGYSCSGQPSVCKVAASGLSLFSPVVINNGAVYATLSTDPVFTFNSQEEMKSFMKYRFVPGTEPTQTFCNQRPADFAKFDCLFLYPSGVPLFKYPIELFYDYQGKKGQISVDVDFASGTLSTRSLA